MGTMVEHEYIRPGGNGHGAKLTVLYLPMDSMISNDIGWSGQIGALVLPNSSW